ncbi:hypothetical protein [Hoylesella timonensis]|nr:hypothetical protein [Hoylesella timonensis]
MELDDEELGSPSSSKKLLPRLTKVGYKAFCPLVCKRSFEEKHGSRDY